MQDKTAGPVPDNPGHAGDAVRKREVTGFSQDLFKCALDFAARAHGAQKVPGSGFPYVVHVAKVAMEVLAATEGEPKLDRNLGVVCALLHDSVEDGANRTAASETLGRIRATFGDAVADGVLALTKNAVLPQSERMADSLRRIKEQPLEVWLVKLADRITNLEPPPPDWTVGRLKEAKVIFETLGDASALLRRRFEQKLCEYAEYCR